MKIDPTVPVHRQPTFTVVKGRGLSQNYEHTHAWFIHMPNGVFCSNRFGNHGCGELRVRLNGRRSYRGRHRR